MTELDRYLDDFGGDLARATGARRPRRRRGLTLAVAALAAAAAFAGILTVTQQPLDPVAQAREALGAPGEIVYMKVTSESPAADGGAVPQTVELWSAADPPRWRLVQEIPAENGKMSDEHGPIRGRQEFSYGNGEQRVYVAERDTLEINQGFSDDGPAALVPTPFNLGSGDVQADLRAMLRDGEVTDLGERREGGRTVRRLVSEVQAGPDTVGRRLVYDVHPESFEPIEATLTLWPGHRPEPGFTTRLRVDAYDRIPIDDESVKLLEIRTTPRTKVTVRTPEQVRERERHVREGCRPRPDRTEACPAPVPPPERP